MNSKAQRTHRTRVTEVETAMAEISTLAASRIENLEQYAVQIEGRLNDRINVLREQLAGETRHRNELAEEQRAYVDKQDRFAEERRLRFIGMTFVQRMRWVFCGI